MTQKQTVKDIKYSDINIITIIIIIKMNITTKINVLRY